MHQDELERTRDRAQMLGKAHVGRAGIPWHRRAAQAMYFPGVCLAVLLSCSVDQEWGSRTCRGQVGLLRFIFLQEGGSRMVSLHPKVFQDGRATAAVETGRDTSQKV